MPICGYILWIPSGEVCSDSFLLTLMTLICCFAKTKAVLHTNHSFDTADLIDIEIYWISSRCVLFVKDPRLQAVCQGPWVVVLVKTQAAMFAYPKGFTMAKLDGMRPTVTQYGSTVSCLVSLLHACKYPVYTLYHRIQYSKKKTWYHMIIILIIRIFIIFETHAFAWKWIRLNCANAQCWKIAKKCFIFKLSHLLLPVFKSHGCCCWGFFQGTLFLGGTT